MKRCATILCVALVSQAFLSCRNRAEDSVSRVRHMEGQLTRQNMIKLTPNTCYYDRLSSSKGRKDINAYLQKIFDRIVAGNPDVFTGDYAPQNFCVSNSPDNFVNAFASPHGRIMFTDVLVKNAPNDAAVAAVIAHETAHILMQHSAIKLNSGSLEPVDHPWLTANQDWKSFLASYPDRSPDIAAKIKTAKTEFEAVSVERANFLAPIRKLLSPITDSAEKRLRKIVTDLSRKAEGLNSEVERLSIELENLKKSPEYIGMTDDQKKSLDEYYGSRIKLVLDYSPILVFASKSAFKELDKIDEIIDDELGRALSSNLDGFIGARWKNINNDYESAKSNLKALEGEKDLNAKVFIDKASSLLGYDYNRYNWMEAEADQVGLELMLKAGFSADGTTGLFKLLMREVGTEAGKDEQKGRQDVESCLTKLSDLKAGKPTVMPERGILSHPETCWRLVNTGYTELVLHEAHYAKFFRKTLVNEMLPGELQRIKSSK